MAYDIGGGGGKAGSGSDSARISLSKPYDLFGTITPEGVQQLNEMLQQLYDAANRVDDVGVQGPSSSTDGNLAVFDGTTGKKLRDGGVQVSVVKLATVDLTAAEIANLNTTPKTVVASVTGKILLPIARFIESNTTVAAGANQNWQTRWTDETAAGAMIIDQQTGFNSGTVERMRAAALQSTLADTLSVDALVGSALDIRLSANPTGTHTARVHYIYVELTPGILS